MSYTPTLLFSYNELEEYKDTLEDRRHYDKAAEFLYSQIMYEPVIYKNQKFVICMPHMSGLNNDVRELLNELDIEYGIDC